MDSSSSRAAQPQGKTTSHVKQVFSAHHLGLSVRIFPMFDPGPKAPVGTRRRPTFVGQPSRDLRWTSDVRNDMRIQKAGFLHLDDEAVVEYGLIFILCLRLCSAIWLVSESQMSREQDYI